MGRISEKMASLHYTTWNLVVLLLWIVWGMLMAASDSFTKGFQEMNNVHISDWLAAQHTDFPVLEIWFTGLCFLMILLGINLIFCSWEKFFRIIRSKFNGPKLFMLIVHAIFGLVAMGHLGGLLLGYEYNNIQLGEGKTYSFEDGYRIEVNGITYISDHKFLEKVKHITRYEFDYKKNFAEVVLSKDGEELIRENVYILDPMEYRGIQVTLRNFMKSPEADSQQGALNSKPWVVITVSRNPVLKIFLVLYPAMIAGIFIYLILTWRTSEKNNVRLLSF